VSFPAVPESAKPTQLPFDLSLRPGYTRDELVVTPANAGAVAMIDRWPDWPSTAVLLAGPSGAGKSHLAAIWSDRARALTVAPEAIDAQAVIAAGAGRPLLVDGIEQALDETGLFHAWNAAREAGGHILMTSRRFPAAWRVKLPDLASRLKTATVVEIFEPDDLLLVAVLTKLFADRQVQVEPHVIAFVANRIERSLATAMRIVDRLDAAAMARKTRISRALASEIIGAEDQGQAAMDF
jgi:chromosomal replication initiation ATPase DnaA